MATALRDMTDDELLELYRSEQQGLSRSKQDVSTLSDEELQARFTQEQGSQRMSYEDATKGDVAAELARSVGRGGKYAVEFAADIGDIIAAPFTEDTTILDELNPFSAPGKWDKWREEEIYDTSAGKFLTEEKIRRGDNALLDAGKTAAEYILPTLTGGAGGAGKQILKEIAFTATGAAGGEALGQALQGKPGTAGEIGEVIGALTGSLGQRKLTAGAKAILTKVLNRVNPKTGEKLTDQEAVHFIQSIMEVSDDPAKAADNVVQALDRGEAGTLAELADDADLFNVESLVEKGSRGARARTAAGEARDAQMLDEARVGFGEGDVTAAPQLAKARTQQAQQRINAATDKPGLARSVEVATDAAQQASKQAENLLDAAKLDVPVSQQSEKLADTYDLVDKRLRDKDVQPLWDDFDAQPPIATPDMGMFLDRTLDAMDPLPVKGIKREFADELEIIRGWGPDTPPAQIHSVISSVKRKLRDVAEAKPYQKEMATITRNLERFLEQSPAGASYTAARNAERKLQQRVSPGSLGKARRTVEDGKLLASKLAKDLEGGALTAQYIKQSASPAIIKQAKDTIRALANRDIKSPAELNTFIRRHDELLNEFPDVKKELLDAQDARFAADITEEAAVEVGKQSTTMQAGLTAARSKARSQLSQSMLARYAADPGATLDTILRNKNPQREMDELIRAVGRTKEGIDSLKAQIGDKFIRNVPRAAGRVDPKAVQEFERIKPLLQKRGLLSPDEIAVVEAALSKTRSTSLRQAAAVAKEGKANKEALNLLASATAASLMSILPGSSLIMAGAIRRNVKVHLTKHPDPIIIKGLQEMIDNPARFREALANYKGPKDGNSIAQYLLRFIQTTAAASLTPTFARPAAIVQLGGEDTLYNE